MSDPAEGHGSSPGSATATRTRRGLRGPVRPGSVEATGDMWFSTDGLVWDGPYERPPGWGGYIFGCSTGAGNGLAMLDDRIIGTGYLFPTPPGEPLRAGLVVGVFIDS